MLKADDNGEGGCFAPGLAEDSFLDDAIHFAVFWLALLMLRTCFTVGRMHLFDDFES
jgi:hypothetical protein